MQDPAANGVKISWKPSATMPSPDRQPRPLLCSYGFSRSPRPDEGAALDPAAAQARWCLPVFPLGVLPISPRFDSQHLYQSLPQEMENIGQELWIDRLGRAALITVHPKKPEWGMEAHSSTLRAAKLRLRAERSVSTHKHFLAGAGPLSRDAFQSNQSKGEQP